VIKAGMLAADVTQIVLTKMQNDAANNAFAGWDTTLWTITNGIPVMNVIG
jgi:hypothetical protein